MEIFFLYILLILFMLLLLIIIYNEINCTLIYKNSILQLKVATTLMDTTLYLSSYAVECLHFMESREQSFAVRGCWLLVFVMPFLI